MKWKGTKKRRVASANYALFVLVCQLSNLVQTEASIAEWLPDSEEKTRWLSMKVLIGFTEDLPLKAEDLGWLLNTKHRNLLGEYMAARNGYLTVSGLISNRNQIKESLNDRLESEVINAGLENEDLLPPAFLAAHISTRQRIRLTDLTEGLVKNNGLALRGHYRVIDSLHKAFKELYPKEIFIRLDPSADPLSALGLPLRNVERKAEESVLPKIHRTEVN